MARWSRRNNFRLSVLILLYFFELTESRLCTKMNHFPVMSLRTSQNDQIRLSYPAQNKPRLLLQKISLDLIGLHHGDPPFHVLANGDKTRMLSRKVADFRPVSHFCVQAPLTIQPMPDEIGPGSPRQQEEDDGNKNGAETCADNHDPMFVCCG